ncbi:2TM domain-containing protein [uncultured Aquimarina sp.]|uniref:2TM domain-containing protein n=1 Tax=uncultured Aquimarina sp. TaxID=575652 RepID=UPI00261099C5|nr:2TM domain-containing protein [uncultured Aquimarina sp.]
MENSELQKAYKRAKKRVTEERAFYTHLSVYVVINIIIIAVILYLKDYFYDSYLLPNLIIPPLSWGVFLLGHGLWTFREKNGLRKKFSRSIFSKKWEERKINEIMDKIDDL